MNKDGLCEAIERRIDFKLNPPGKGTAGFASYQNQKVFAKNIHYDLPEHSEPSPLRSRKK